MARYSPASLKMSRRTAATLCLLVGAIWGFGFIATSRALDTFGPGQVLLVRFTGAALIAWIPLLARRTPITRRALGKGLICGLFLYLAFLLQTLGLQETEAGSNAFFTSANVVMVPFLAWMVTDRRPAWLQFAACLLCFAGVGLMGWTGEGISLRTGDLYSLGCAFFFACHIVSLQWASDQETNVITALQMSVAAILSLLPGLQEAWPVDLDWLSVLSLLYLIAGSTWLAFWLQTRAQEYIDASRASLLLATESLWANLFAILLLHEHLSGLMACGGLMILLAVCMTELAPSMKEKGARSSLAADRDRVDRETRI